MMMLRNWLAKTLSARAPAASEAALSVAAVSRRALSPAALSPAALVLLLASCGSPPEPGVPQPPPAPSPPLPPVAESELRPVAAFASLAEGPTRSQALFSEMARVLLHPRCVNCHVQGESPAQGDYLELHDPPVVRGEEGRGVVGMECSTCHQDRNLQLSRVPGAVGWRLPPAEMAWEGKSPAELCAQLKDPARNGQRGLAELIEHSRRDALVAWGWQPGFDRRPPPGTQAEFAALVAAWVESGAACPDSSVPAPPAAAQTAAWSTP